MSLAKWCVTSAPCVAALSWASFLCAAPFPEFVDPNPAVGNQFGAGTVALSTGNVVITAPGDDFGGTDAGAVYLFSGATGALISTMHGSSAGDRVGSGGVRALVNGNYLVISPGWDNGAITNAGAVTWGSGTTGVAGAVSAVNSLVGSSPNDSVGSFTSLALPNGNYVVGSSLWDNGAAANAGAVTWGSGTTGVTGVVSGANSLVGTSAGDRVGLSITVLANNNFVVSSPLWDKSAVVDAGAATWGSGTTGVTGAISAANSLVGSTAGDNVGGVTALTNGNYVVASTSWDNGAIANAGAVTWGSGTTGVTGAVSAVNSLVGSTASDNVGAVTALTNGNYVVASLNWDGAIANAGAVTWASGTSVLIGTVSAANSLVGSTANDQVGFFVAALTNGNYVVASPGWDSGAIVDAGAATWGSGTTGVSGVVSGANSLVGSTASDFVGGPAAGGVTALSNGHYVVASMLWNNGAVADVGAVTWGSGTTGVTGAISVANSLVGTTAGDNVGNGGGFGGVTPLTNGNYVVRSTNWDNGAITGAGAVTWGNGTTATSGAVSAANSLVGSSAGDLSGASRAVALANGNYVVVVPLWNNGGVADVGAVTWGNGTTGESGAISVANSLVGSTASDQIGSHGVTVLPIGSYVVVSRNWDNGAIANAGAVTWGSGTSVLTGTVSAANSLVGSTANDQVGSNGVTALANGNYVVGSRIWDNGATADAGAATWGDGATGVSGAVSPSNSLVGTAAVTTLQPEVPEDIVNGAFLVRFLAEGGGRVRVGDSGAGLSPVIVSLADILDDQGGRLRLTFRRSSPDSPSGSPPISRYGVWRRVPSTLTVSTGEVDPGRVVHSRSNASTIERSRVLLPAGLDGWEVGGRFYATGTSSRSAETAVVLPPGTWELLSNIPALQQAQYLVAVPTISNAAPNDFVITAHTTSPTIWYTSNPSSGQSIDNIAPAQPTGLTAAYASDHTNLQWAANIENDLGAYRLYRGTSAAFTPSPGNLIASQIGTDYADMGPAGGYYKLSAVDVNGNESLFALITPQQTTDVGDGTLVVFAMHGARPNPATGRALHVAFALPSAAPARLELLDVGGRLVATREVGTLGAGRHTVNLARDHDVAPGVYWLRLIQGTNQQRTRVAVIR